MSTSALHEIVYKCSNSRCGNTQTLSFWADEAPFPVTCCTKCRAGFGIPSVGEMIASHVGMFPQTA